MNENIITYGDRRRKKGGAGILKTIVSPKLLMGPVTFFKPITQSWWTKKKVDVILKFNM